MHEIPVQTLKSENFERFKIREKPTFEREDTAYSPRIVSCSKRSSLLQINFRLFVFEKFDIHDDNP